jgi:hypothetical protein
MDQRGADYFYKLAMESRVAALRARDPVVQAKWRDAEECWIALASQMEADSLGHIINQEPKERHEP